MHCVGLNLVLRIREKLFVEDLARVSKRLNVCFNTKTLKYLPRLKPLVP